MLSLIRTLQIINNDSAGSHDELYVAQIGNVRDQVTIQNDDVCELPRFERADLVTETQVLGGVARHCGQHLRTGEYATK